MSDASRTIGLPIRQRRSRETQERLLDAADAIIRKRGEPTFTIAEVAKRAGCAVGAVYRRFENKEQLLEAVIQRWVQDAEDQARTMLQPSVWEGAGITRILEVYLRVATATTRRSGGTSRVLLRAAMLDSDLGKRANRLQRLIDRSLRRLLRSRREEIGHPEPDLAIDFTLEQLRGHLMARRFGEPVFSRSRLSDEEFISQTFDSVVRYLQLEEPLRDGAV